MKLVTATSSISGKIESIIKEAEKDLYLVSPYIQLEKSDTDQWKSINKSLHFACKQGVKIYMIARQKKENKIIPIFEDLKQKYGKSISIFLLPNLHAKLYYNGTDALITSMNMYLHSSRKNHEIGVSLDREANPQDMKKLKKFIGYLMEDAIEYKTDEEKQVEEQLHAQHKAQQQDDQDNRALIQFEVLSIGYKWIKVLTSDGYENKILIKDAPDLKEEQHYLVKAKKKWSKTPYGYSVQLINVHDVEEIAAFCVGCRKPTDGKYELCYSCNKVYKKTLSSFKFRFCKICGKEKPNIDIQHPICKACFKKQKIERKPVKSNRIQSSSHPGYCIQCGKEIAYDSNLKKIRCKTCWKKDKTGDHPGNFCFYCGKAHQSSLRKPVCYSCYQKHFK